jgi:hypothetical protein
MDGRFDIFISYRRKGGYDTAKLLYDRLRMDGYSVSFDMDTLANGNFDSELEQRVKSCKDFLLVLNLGCFDRFFDPNPDYDPENDWVRREIKCALAENKNIIPLFMEGFVFPKNLPDDVKGITRKNALDLNPKYFEAAYEKMKSFLISKPYWMVRHKKKIISFISIALLAAASYFYFGYNQKNLELQKAQIAADAKMKRTLDSIDSARTEWREKRRRGKTFHWKGGDDIIEQIIFEKIKEGKIEKTQCSGNGMIVSPNKVNCRENDAKKIICFYSPKITFTTCDNRPVTFLETGKRFRTEPQTDEAAAKEELANKLKEADFGDWVSFLKDSLAF